MHDKIYVLNKMALISLCGWASSFNIDKQSVSCMDPEGETGGLDLPFLKNHKKLGFLRNTGPDPLKNQTATKPVFYGGPSSASQQNAI